MSNRQYSADWQHLPGQPCPWCGHILNAVGQAGVNTAQLPEAGDRTVYIRCVEASIFGTDGRLRRAHPDELDAEIRDVQADIRRMQPWLT